MLLVTRRHNIYELHVLLVQKPCIVKCQYRTEVEKWREEGNDRGRCCVRNKNFSKERGNVVAAQASSTTPYVYFVFAFEYGMPVL